uniref:B- and T-lymphocyte attenuator-like n=1 Tax=Scatophagus argus TaxID=75038 RepID=UPI001ED84122|nr:B- and T-lymphocyte attenuator-like [Scatophagus argus]
MTAGFLSAPIMRPNHCWTVLQVCILVVQLLTLNAGGEDSGCEIEIMVRRRTVYKVFAGEHFSINCTVVFCNNSPPTVFWHKREDSDPVNVSSGHITTKWTKSSSSEGIFYLFFQGVLESDSGEYQCQGGGSISHSINVTVYDKWEHTSSTPKTVTNVTSVPDNPPKNLWLYVYTAAGIVTFVVLVIVISVASMLGCKGKSKKETQADNLYTAVAMVAQPFPHATSRGSPTVPPSRRSTQRKSLPAEPNELPLAGDNGHLYGGTAEDREGWRNMLEEERSSIVYAALNHQPLAGAAVRSWRQQEETSEYAAIRVKDQ